jgi:hypothetical protein
MKPRHAFLVRETATIPPLGHPAAETWLLDGTLHQRMVAALERAGLTVVRVDSLAEAEAATEKTASGAIVALDSVAFSTTVLKHLLVSLGGEGGRRAVQAALPDGVSTRRFARLEGLTPVTVDGAAGFAAPMWALAPGARTAEARPQLLPFKEQVQKVPMPVGMIGLADFEIGVSDTYLVRVDHWAHVMWLNQSAMIGSWSDLWNRAGGRLWLIWRALLGFPWVNGRLGASIRRVHPKAKVHHRAFIDGSVIEEGAEIGANAIVRLSWIGKGARVEDGAVVSASVLGPGASVASGSTVTAAVLYPRAFAAQHKMQLCVFGEAAVAFTGSYFYDINFQRNVQVAHRGKIADSGERFLSVCLGPWSRIAGGVWIGGGREVPAGALVVQPVDHVLYKMNEELAATRMVTVAGRGMVDAGELPSNRPAESAPRALGPKSGS